MFIDNFLKATAMEAKTAAAKRDLLRYIDSVMINRARIRVGVLNRLKDQGIDKLTKKEFAFFFPTSTMNIEATINAAKEAETATKSCSCSTRAQNKKGEKNAEVVPGQEVEEKEERNVWLPSEREIIESSDLWEAIKMCLATSNRTKYMEKNLRKHIEVKILQYLDGAIDRAGDREIVDHLSHIIAKAVSLD